MVPRISKKNDQNGKLTLNEKEIHYTTHLIQDFYDFA